MYRRCATFSGAFVFVECDVRALQEFLGGLAGFVVSPAAGELQADFVAGEVELEAFEAAENVANFFGAALGKNGHEFIAAEADSEVRTANGALQAVGEALQQRIAGGVAVIVIDLLQAVHVHEKDGERTTMTLRAADFLSEALFAGATIVEAGELIEGCELIDFRRERFDFGQRLNLVGDLMMQTHDLSLLIDEVDAKDQDEANQGSDGLVQEEGVGALVAIEHGGEGKRGHAESKEQDDGDRCGPEPPLATVEVLETFANLVGLQVRARKAFGLGVGARFGHRISRVSAFAKDARATGGTLYVSFARFPFE